VQRRTSTWRHSREPKSLRLLQSVLESHPHRNCTNESELAPTSCTNNAVRRKVMSWRIGCKRRRKFFHSQELMRNHFLLRYRFRSSRIRSFQVGSGTVFSIIYFNLVQGLPRLAFITLAGSFFRPAAIPDWLPSCQFPESPRVFRQCFFEFRQNLLRFTRRRRSLGAQPADTVVQSAGGH